MSRTFRIFFFLLLFKSAYCFAQVNLVGNPGFEDQCNPGVQPFWPGLDSSYCSSGVLFSECNGSAPKNIGFQYARSGISYLAESLFIKNYHLRPYPKNRLITTLMN